MLLTEDLPKLLNRHQFYISGVYTHTKQILYIIHIVAKINQHILTQNQQLFDSPLSYSIYYCLLDYVTWNEYEGILIKLYQLKKSFQ